MRQWAPSPLHTSRLLLALPVLLENAGSVLLALELSERHLH